MVGPSGRVLVVLAFAALVNMAEDASARTIRRSCRDGLTAKPTIVAGATLSCDVDAQCDGVCSFSVPVCGASACEADTLTVPTRRTLRARLVVQPGAAPTTLVLRCRPRNASCITVTTTTGGAATTGGPTTTSPTLPPGPTTTTRVRLVGPGSTSSTTSSSTSSILPTSTTTSTVPVPCRTDANCDGLASACAVAACSSEETCVVACVCLEPDGARTCSLDAATPCLTPDDCPGLDRDDCRVCYLNLCVTAPAPACF